MNGTVVIVSMKEISIHCQAILFFSSTLSIINCSTIELSRLPVRGRLQIRFKVPIHFILNDFHKKISLNYYLFLFFTKFISVSILTLVYNGLSWTNLTWFSISFNFNLFWKCFDHLAAMPIIIIYSKMVYKFNLVYHQLNSSFNFV